MTEQGKKGEAAEGLQERISEASQARERPAYIYVNHLLAGETVVHAYRFTLAGSETMQEAAEDAIRSIKSGKKRVPGSHKKIYWTRASYIVFILEDAAERLTKIEFRIAGTSINKSFVDETPLNDFDNKFSGIYYTNARLNRQGQPLEDGEAELYRWKALHSRRDGKGDPRTHENSGTNIGP